MPLNDSRSAYFRIFLIIFLAAGVTVLHYSTAQSESYHHIVFRELYFIPIILAAFWYGFRGGLLASLGISALYVPHIMINWQNFSPDDLNKCIEVIIFNLVALVLGIMKDQEKRREREKREALLAMAGAVAHELNSPIQVVLGSSQLLQDDFEPESETYNDLKVIINNTKTIQKIVSRISRLDQFILTGYAGDDKIVEIPEERGR